MVRSTSSHSLPFRSSFAVFVHRPLSIAKWCPLQRACRRPATRYRGRLSKKEIRENMGWICNRRKKADIGRGNCFVFSFELFLFFCINDILNRVENVRFARKFQACTDTGRGVVPTQREFAVKGLYDPVGATYIFHLEYKSDQLFLNCSMQSLLVNHSIFKNRLVSYPPFRKKRLFCF